VQQKFIPVEEPVWSQPSNSVSTPIQSSENSQSSLGDVPPNSQFGSQSNVFQGQTVFVNQFGQPVNQFGQLLQFNQFGQAIPIQRQQAFQNQGQLQQVPASLSSSGYLLFNSDQSILCKHQLHSNLPLVTVWEEILRREMESGY
jgi:hypothetical protein